MPIIFEAIFLFWLLLLTLTLFWVIWQGKKIKGSVSSKDFRSVERLVREIEEVKEELAFNLKKIGLVRYNPFAETGGEQSFSLALTDERGNGLVLSNLHHRESARIYIKVLKQGQATSLELSEEEKKAVKLAEKFGKGKNEK